jgi:hypothetical protein
MSQPIPPLAPPSMTLPRPWRQMSPAQQQQLAQRWAQLLQRLQPITPKEKPRADEFPR